MRDEVLSYREMCDREGIQTLQRGMNFRLNSSYSVVLMSRRTNAPYVDRILDDGMTIVYEGHDTPRTFEHHKPKEIDQPRSLPSGRLTQNGLFADSVDRFCQGQSREELVRVYEKLFPGVWSDKGIFALRKYEYVSDGKRKVFQFYLTPVSESLNASGPPEDLPVSRVIPAEVKKQVWKRDNGRCVKCGREDNLHFDHVLPWSKGGASITAENVQLLCTRHNLEKSDKIE